MALAQTILHLMSYIFVNDGIITSLPGPSHDIVTDFTQGEDNIYLYPIDANLGQGGNQDFTFIGENSFTGRGQVRFVAQGTDTIVQANNGGSLDADLEVLLTGSYKLTASDFTL